MDPTNPPGSTGASNRFLVFALLAVVVVAGAITAIVLLGGDSDPEPDDPSASIADATAQDDADDSSADDSGSTETDASLPARDDGDGSASEPANPDELDALIAELSAETERLRGLEFLEPVDATFLSDDDFRARLLAELDADLDADEMREIEWAWQALGFIEPGVSLEAVLRQALGDGVLGFYDPESDELVMRGVVIDDFLRSTLVHELTHALDDQHFDLDRPSLMDGEDSEAQFGFTGLVEGTAVYVEELWVSGLDTDRLLQLRQAEAAFGADIDYSGLPEALLIDLSLPYIIGPSFVNELVAEGGLDRIDAAYLEPPVTGEQLFDADAYLTGDTAVDVDLPPSDGDVLTDGVIGASGFYELFLLFSPSDATVISEWDGDRFVVWAGDGDEVCLRVDVAAEGDDGRAAFESALESYASLSGAGEVENAGDLLRLTVCR